MKKILFVGFLISFLFLFSSFFPKEEKIETVMMEMDDIKPQNTFLIYQYQKKYENNDIVAVLSIDQLFEQEIVVQGNDNDYYWHHNFKKEEDENGCIFMDYRVDLSTMNKILLYGKSTLHNLPFSSLSSYRNTTFLKEHPNITFEMQSKKAVYQIFSVMFLEEDSFYEIFGLKGNEWTKHLNEMKEKSIYPIDYDMKQTDRVLLLSTKQEDKTLVIAAVLIDEIEF